MAESSNPGFGISKVHYCPVCRKPLRRMNGKMGPFWGCTGFPDCHMTLDDVDGKPSREPDEQFCCPVCTRRMVKRQNRQGGPYWVCTGAAKGCDVSLADDEGKPARAFRCRSCGHLLVKRQGRHGLFWGCSHYPDCNQTYNDRDGAPDLDFFTAKNP